MGIKRTILGFVAIAAATTGLLVLGLGFVVLLVIAIFLPPSLMWLFFALGGRSSKTVGKAWMNQMNRGSDQAAPPSVPANGDSPG
jgi:hypothetical protein